jgi:hypothetical protein
LLDWFHACQILKVGDKIRVCMHGGKIVDAVIKAIIDKTDALHYQIDFGNEQTALIREWQIVRVGNGGRKRARSMAIC